VILAELGSSLLLLSLAVTVFSCTLSAVAARQESVALAALARRSFFAATAMVAGASAALLVALLSHDFVIAYVTEHTDRSLPPALTAAAFYGGQEGSLLYWALLLMLCASVALVSSRLTLRTNAYANAILAGIAVFFLVVLVFVASPFALLEVTPGDGLGLNPVLRDGGMLIHPPFLLAGYSAFAVPFAFALAWLLGGREDTGGEACERPGSSRPLAGGEAPPQTSWVEQVRRFALVAWALQTVGLTLGMWWAYHVLGWGGYWGWDPVENAALMPWLATTAYIHSAQVQERRGSLRGWSVGLVVGAFLLSILGTFLVRSGVLPSVHSFAVSPLGPWFLGFLVVATAVSGGVLAWRSERLRSSQPIVPGASREGAFLVQNMLLVALTAAVLWGTVLPLISGLTGRELVVGPAYYERVGAPLFIAILALLAVGPALPWSQGGGRRDAAGIRAAGGGESPPKANGGWTRLLRWPLTAAGLALAGLLAAGVRQPGALLALPLVAAGMATCVAEYGRGARSARHLGLPWALAAARLLARNRRRYGAYLAHAGILAVAAGLAGSHLWQQSRTVTLQPGQSVTVAGQSIAYEGTAQSAAGDHADQFARLRVGSDTLEPGRLTYASLGGQSVTKVAIRSTPLEDLYVVLDAVTADGATLTVYVNPLVTWIWAGAALLVAGVLLGHLALVPVTALRAPAMAGAPAPLPHSSGEVARRARGG
jgi:cytochrome c-type biogenesis protein CcmF